MGGGRPPARDDEAGGARARLVGYYGIFQPGFALSVVDRGGFRPIQDYPLPPTNGWYPQRLNSPARAEKLFATGVDICRSAL